MNSPKFAFFGTPHLAVWVLEELKNKNILPSLVVTSPDRKSGRKMELHPSAVKVWAKENNVPVQEIATFKKEGTSDFLKKEEWDLFVVAAYNFILPESFLNIPKYGTINVHPSLLPKLRGPSPVRSAILYDAKDAVGVTIMKLDAEVDHGPIIAQERVELREWPIKGRVLDELLFRRGGQKLAEIINDWIEVKIEQKEQNHTEATFTKKFKKEDGLINLDDDAYQNYLKFCGYDIWPRTYFINDGKRNIITDASYENGKFVIKKIIPEGGKEIEHRN